MHSHAPKPLQGETIFHDMCSPCHGPDGRGEIDLGKKLHAADLTSSAVQSMSESELFAIVKSGKGKMPSFNGKLSDGDIKAVVSYVKQLGKK
jgi:mono/diheme cytochrome c family protein